MARSRSSCPHRVDFPLGKVDNKHKSKQNKVEINQVDIWGKTIPERILPAIFMTSKGSVWLEPSE